MYKDFEKEGIDTSTLKSDDVTMKFDDYFPSYTTHFDKNKNKYHVTKQYLFIATP